MYVFVGQKNTILFTSVRTYFAASLTQLCIDANLCNLSCKQIQFIITRSQETYFFTQLSTSKTMYVCSFYPDPYHAFLIWILISLSKLFRQRGGVRSYLLTTLALFLFLSVCLSIVCSSNCLFVCIICFAHNAKSEMPGTLL